MFEDKYGKDRDKANEEIKQKKLSFTPKDIRYIFVKTDNDIPGLVDFINTKLEHHSQKDIKILTTKIISLQTIKVDL